MKALSISALFLTLIAGTSAHAYRFPDMSCYADSGANAVQSAALQANNIYISGRPVGPKNFGGYTELKLFSRSGGAILNIFSDRSHQSILEIFICQAPTGAWVPESIY